MPNSGFTFRFDYVDPDISRDCVAVIKNDTDWNSGKRIHITDINMLDPSGFNSDLANTLGNQGILSLDRISAYSGGTELTNPSKFDTGAANMASQVKFMVFPDSVTVDSTVRRVGNVAGFSITVNPNFTIRAPGVLDANDHSGRSAESWDMWHIPGVSDMEPLVLREGEGAAVVLRAFGTLRSYHFAVFVRVSGTGNVYRYRTANTCDKGDIGTALWSLFNGSGSGVVLQVYIVQFPTMGESNIPRYRLARLNGFRTLGDDGASVSPVKRDTAADLTGVVGWTGPLMPDILLQGTAQNYWDYQSTPVTIAQQQQAGVFRHWLDAGPGWMETGTPGLSAGMFEQNTEVWPGERRKGYGSSMNDDILLLPGESVGIIAGGNGLVDSSEGAVAIFEVQGYFETPSTGSAVYPVVGHVRAPDTYGPTGSDYTGTETLPAVGDVKTGVTYGAGGTEFTGTYSGGGGGGKRRIRVVA